ncbi:MAG: peptidoglycan DD-metalloendopeptidase family protein [Alphaproteobacteria bacterium]
MTLARIVAFTGLLLLVACAQAPAPVTFGSGGNTVNSGAIPPLPSDPPASRNLAKVPPLPGQKPPTPGEQTAVAAVSSDSADDLISRIEQILFADANAPEPEPVVEEVVTTGAGTVSVITAERGDTVYGLSRRLGVTPREIIEANGLEAPYELLVGQRLTIPGSESSTVAWIEESTLPEAPAGVVTAIPEPAPRGDLQFIWPVEGPIISTYGPKTDGFHNDGINIAAPAGSPVVATEDGVVAYTGDELRGYGNLVLVKHADGWVSAYAHNAQVLVARGQTVLRGDTIASVGASGGVDAPQSHFELRRGTDAVDPVPYLNNL